MPFVHRLEEAVLEIARLREMNSNALTIIKEQHRVLEGVREHNADRFSELCRVQDLLLRDLGQRTRSADIAMRESTGLLQCSKVARGHLRVLEADWRPARWERPQASGRRWFASETSRPCSPPSPLDNATGVGMEAANWSKAVTTKASPVRGQNMQDDSLTIYGDL
ncbi:hypothetical protein DL770_008806 [Monosporascus sp. CRB-9-2]|nr:hypothetical protein DL770_008806 [Monosporascus sp. CRB-9-2]